MRKLIFLLAFVLLISSVSALVNITSPANNTIQFPNPISVITFVNSSSSATVINTSLYDNSSGAFALRTTTNAFNLDGNGTYANVTVNSGFSTQVQTSKYGNRITIGLNDVYIHRVNCSTGSTATTIYVCSGEIGNTCAQTFVTASCGSTFATPLKLNASTTYKLLADAGGASYTRTYKTGSFHGVVHGIDWISNEGGDANEFGQTWAVEMASNQFLNTTANVTFNYNFSVGSILYGVQACYSNNTCEFSANKTLSVPLIYNTSYSSPVFETSNETFSINVSYDTNFVLANIYLVYNGTSYLANKTGNTASYTLLIPSVSVSGTNKTFYWNITLVNSTGNNYFQTTTNTQTINKGTNLSVGTSCSVGYSSAISFSSFYEINGSAINISTVNYYVTYGLSGNSSANSINNTLSNVAGFNICINNTQSYYDIGYGEIQYSVAGSVDRRYYLFGGTRITNNTISIPIYALESSSSTSFLLTAQTSALSPYVGYYITAMRWYPSSNTYKIVDMGKTDGRGQTVLRVKTEDVDYRLGLYTSQGVLVKLLDPIRLICQTNPCTYSLFADVETTDLTIFNNIQESLNYNPTSKVFTFTWNDPSQTPQVMNLTVYQETGTSTQLICNSSASGYTGVILCDVSAYTGTLRATVTRTASPFTIIAQLTIDAGKELFSDVTNGGTLGLLLGVTLMAFFALIGTFSPVIVVILGMVSLVPLYYLGSINIAVLTAIGVLGGVILHLMRKTN